MERVQRKASWWLVVYTAWAGALALGGLRAIALPEAQSLVHIPKWVWVVIGVSMLGMAQHVFSDLVADRLFPHANPWVSGLVPLAAGMIFVGGFALLLVGAVL